MAEASGARLNVSVGPDGARLSFLPASGAEGGVDLTLAQLTELIGVLGAARAKLAGPGQGLDGQVQAIVGPAWTVRPEALTEGSMLAFAHPAYGPVGFVLAAAEVERMVRALTSHLGMVRSGEVGEARN